MKKCFYCGKELKEEDNYIDNKIGYFCNDDHYNKYMDSLSDKEYIELQNSFLTYRKV